MWRVPQIFGPEFVAQGYETVDLVISAYTVPKESIGWWSLGTFGLHSCCLSDTDMYHLYGCMSALRSHFPSALSQNILDSYPIMNF